MACVRKRLLRNTAMKPPFGTVTLYANHPINPGRFEGGETTKLIDFATFPGKSVRTC